MHPEELTHRTFTCSVCKKKHPRVTEACNCCIAVKRDRRDGSHLDNQRTAGIAHNRKELQRKLDNIREEE